MLFRSDSKLVIVSVVPNFSHILPVDDFTVRNGVFKEKDALCGLGLIAHIGFLLIHAYHTGGHLGFAYKSGKLAAGSIFAREPCFAESGSIIDDN